MPHPYISDKRRFLYSLLFLFCTAIRIYRVRLCGRVHVSQTELYCIHIQCYPKHLEGIYTSSSLNSHLVSNSPSYEYGTTKTRRQFKEFSDEIYWQVADQPGMEGPNLSSWAIQES